MAPVIGLYDGNISAPSEQSVIICNAHARIKYFLCLPLGIWFQFSSKIVLEGQM